MSLYRRKGSRYWWMWLEGVYPPQRSTKIPIDGASPEQSKRNKALALAIYHTTIAEIRAGKYGLSPKPTMSFTAFATWYLEHITEKKRGKEREAYTIGLLIDHFGSRPLAEITKAHTAEWMTTRAKAVAVSTVNRELDVLKHMLASAVPTYLNASPIARLARLRAARGEKGRPAAILSTAHETKLLAALKPADRALVLVAICTLLRLSDVLDLKWADYHGTWIEVLDPKNGKPIKIPLAKRARGALAELKPPANAIYVFTSRRHGTDSERRNRIKMMLRWACQRADIPYGRAKGGITFHSFRHTGATRMLAAGVDPRTVQEIGGWSSLAQVMRYTHPTDTQRRRAVEHI